MTATKTPPRTWSQWELDELLWLHRNGWRTISLASLYGCSERAIQRRLRSMGALQRNNNTERGRYEADHG